MTRNHFIFGVHRASVKCAVCREFTDQPHCLEGVLFCDSCCPSCHPTPPAERTGPVVGLVGEQGRLL